MKRKRNRPGVLAIALVLILAGIIGLWIAHLFMYERSSNMEHRAKDVTTFILEDIAEKVKAGGAPALETVDESDYIFWEWAGNSLLPDNLNAVLLDSDGTILAQTGTLLTEGLSRLNLLRAQYQRDYLDWYHKDQYLSVYEWTSGRLCLLLNDQGEIVSRFLDTGGDDSLRMIGSAALSQYREFFPAIDGDMYRRITGDVWDFSGYDEEEPPRLAGTQTFTEAERYVGWENEQLELMGDLRACITPLTGAQSGRVLAVFYRSNDATHVGLLEAARFERMAGALIPYLLALLLLWWILLPIWVYRDARKRAFRPAMWGILTLMGNIAAWIVYMLVRPDRKHLSRCPACGAALKPAFAFCPACGQKARGRCPGCLRAVEDDWKICPYCGKALEESE